jgi:hypothetical protein
MSHFQTSSLLKATVLPWLACLGLLGGALPSAAPATLAEMRVARSEEEVLLFALRLDQALLSNTFPGFDARGGTLVPLGEFCRLLDLAIQSDPQRGRAEGFFLRETRRFILDVQAGTLSLDGRVQSFDRTRVELHQDDIYVDAELLAQWLPLGIRVDRRSATITVLPREPLPIQERWQRELRLGRFRPSEGPRQFPISPDPYRLAEVPMVDETLRLTAQNAPGLERRLRGQSTTFATGDLLAMSASLYALVDAGAGRSDFRMTLGRRDPQAGLLGPLRATEFTFGDVLDPGMNLLSLPQIGTGAVLSNLPLQRENAFDRHSFQGDLAPGWQVELYRNQALLGFQSARTDGRYEFLNVPLSFGWNDFRLVFYGPQGQRREEVVRFDVSENQTPAGAFQYRLVGVDPKLYGSRAHGEIRYGLSEQVAAGVAFSSLQLDGRTHAYTQANLQGFWKPLSALLTAAQDREGGHIAELGLRSRIGSASLTARHATLQGGFESEVFRPIYGKVQSRSALETSILLPSLERNLVTLDLGASRDRLVDGAEVNRLSNRLSTSFQGFFLSNEIVRTQGQGSTVALPSSTLGDFLASKFFRTFSLRGQANYQLDGGRRWNAFAAFLESPRFDPYNLRIGLTRSLVAGDTILQAGLQKNQGTFALGVDVSYSTRNRLTLDLTFRIGLGREPRSGRFAAQAQGLASHGAASVQTFLDANGNGQRDPGEKPVPGASFMTNGASRPQLADETGVAFLTSLPADQEANISVNPSSLEDPLMRSGVPGHRITPRPGHVARLELPLVVLGEVTGTAYLKQGPNSSELPGLRVELLTASGQVFKSVRTAFDGFFTLSDLPAGDYQLRVTAEEAQRLGVAAPPSKAIHISSEGTLLDGVDLLLVTGEPHPGDDGSMKAPA